jgi:hypothetical protein
MTNKNVCKYIVLRKGTTGRSEQMATVDTVEVKQDWGFEAFNAEIGASTGSVLRVGSLTNFLPEDVKAGHGIKSVDMWIDDEGRMSSDAVVNEYATVLTSQLVYGDCVLFTTDHEGNSSPLKNDVLANVLSVLSKMMHDPKVAEAVAVIKKLDKDWVDKHGLMSISFDSEDGVTNV